jgi:hypothetical protein
MLKSLSAVGMSAVIAVLLWKVLAVILLPLFGVALGIVFTIVKVVFIAAAVLLAFWIYRRMNRSTATA